MSDTTIEWATKTWNPTTGCDRVSPGCDNCYALTMAKRLKGMGSKKYQRDGDPKTSGPGFGLSIHPDTLDLPLKWRKPQRVFVNSMSDLFHDEVPDDYIAKVWAVMASAPQHIFQVLTKRHARMRSLLTDKDGGFFDAVADYSTPGVWRIGGDTEWPLRNVWIGVSAENQQWTDIRGDALRATPAAVRFFSFEPLLGLVNDVNLDGIHWAIVGGESGPGARPMHPDWARSLRDQCQAAGVPFFFKQWGEWAPAPWHGPNGASHAFTGGLKADGTEHFMQLSHGPISPERDHATPRGAQGMLRVGKKQAGRLLDGREWNEYPT